MIRYTFFFEEGHIASDVDSKFDDQRIADHLDDLELLYIGGQKDIYVNTDKVKCIVREIVDVEKTESKAIEVGKED